MRIEAVLVNDDNLEAKKYMLEVYPELKTMYSAEDNKIQVFYLENATATLVSMPWNFQNRDVMFRYMAYFYCQK